MGIVRITGTFINSGNNSVMLSIVENLTGVPVFRHPFNASFPSIPLNLPPRSYHVSAVGFTTGEFTLTITGDVVSPAIIHGTNVFNQGTVFTVKF